MAVGKETVVADALEAVGEHVQQEAAQKLVRIETHDLLRSAAGIVAPCESDLAVIEGDEASARWRMLL